MPNGQQTPAPDGRRWLRRTVWGLGILGVLVLGAALVLFLTGGSKALRDVLDPSEPERAAFAFDDPTLKLTPLAGSPSADSVRDEAEQIRERLSEFYDTAFMNPDTWADGLPAEIWDGFTPDAAAQAKAEPEALTLGLQPRLEQLGGEESSLALNVLFDTKKRPTAIIAGVSFQATGELKDGSTFTVVSEAQFLFRLISHEWVVAGFPTAEVKVDSEPPPSPQPSASVGSPETSP
jgi:hypothetical protein